MVTDMRYSSGEFEGSEALLVTLAQNLAYHPSLPNPPHRIASLSVNG
jgi:hypothetical protein